MSIEAGNKYILYTGKRSETYIRHLVFKNIMALVQCLKLSQTVSSYWVRPLLRMPILAFFITMGIGHET